MTDTPTTPTELRRVVFGSLVGTALEWYDFFIYGTAAALVFDDLFFPHADPAIGTSSRREFGVGFVFRPVGGSFFGHLGDRIGRRSTLVITTLVMGVVDRADRAAADVRVDRQLGADPAGAAADRARAWAPAPSSAARRPCSPSTRRPAAAGTSPRSRRPGPDRSVARHRVFLLVGSCPDEELKRWGWRIPFLVSFLLIGVALYVRLRVASPRCSRGWPRSPDRGAAAGADTLAATRATS